MNCRECKYLKVMQNFGGYWYIGTWFNGEPYCRASEYYPGKVDAEKALKTGFVLRDCVEINAVMDGLVTCEVNI